MSNLLHSDYGAGEISGKGYEFQRGVQRLPLKTNQEGDTRIQMFH